MRILHLHLKAKHWHKINRGEKPFEYRLANDYWERLLRAAPYDAIYIYLGYPKKNDDSRILKRKWVDWPKQEKITHEEFGDKAVWVYAIDVTQALNDCGSNV